ncbi:MAG TPA: FMN-binding negative transcriptional regulator [Aquihabitans sp.]|nr:FMN-binding negative transcriptional regulator [Aquihabitans sp.]
MHRPPAFDVDDPAALLATLLEQVAATLVTVGPRGMESTLLPMLYDPGSSPHGTLLGHVARANPLVRDRHAGEALVVVTGVQAYVSPSWYPSKARHGKVVPTWDYVTVQAAGPLVLHDDPAWLLAQVGALTERHERGRAEPWSPADAPASYLEQTLRGIVGVEVPLDRLAGKAKLSQNRPADDVEGVIAGLRAEDQPGASAAADAVRAAAAGASRPGGGGDR